MVDLKFTDDVKSSPKNRIMPSDGTIENGMDFVRMYKMVSKLFKKDTVENSGSNSDIDFSDAVSKGVDSYFFTNTLKLKSSEIGLFLDYCENDPKAKTLLKEKDEFMLIDFVNGQLKPIHFLSKEMEGDVLICYFNIKEIHKINTLEIYNAVITEGNTEQQNIMHFNVIGVKNTLLFTESTSKGLLKY